MSAGGEDYEGLPLPALFSRGRAAAEQAEEPAGPGAPARAQRQRLLQQGLAALQRAAAAVDSLALFSANEEREDLATGDLKYLLIHFYRAQLLAQVQPEDRQARLEALGAAQRQYKSYLHTARQYSLLGPQAAAMAEGALEQGGEEDDEGGQEGGSSSSIVVVSSGGRAGGQQGLDPGTMRQQKIEKFKRERFIKGRLQELQQQQAAAGGGQGEEGGGSGTGGTGGDAEEREREVWLLQLDLAGLQAAERVGGLAQETALLRHAVQLAPEEEQQMRQAREQGAPGGAGDTGERVAALRAASAALGASSAIVRREQLRQDALFKPTVALPTISIEQQGEIELRQAIEQQRRQAAAEERQQRRQAEARPEDLEEEEVQKQRAWDDWADDNPRGWGNSKLRPCA